MDIITVGWCAGKKFLNEVYATETGNAISLHTVGAVGIKKNPTTIGKNRMRKLL